MIAQTIMDVGFGKVRRAIEFSRKVELLTPVFGSREEAQRMASDFNDLTAIQLRSIGPAGRSAADKVKADSLTKSLIPGFEKMVSNRGAYASTTVQTKQLNVEISRWEHLFASNDIYNDVSRPDLPPSGYRRLSQKEADDKGLTKPPSGPMRINVSFVNEYDGFYAGLYETPQKGRYIFAFRGSEDGLDWKTNVPAAANGEGKQYRYGIGVAKVLSDNAHRLGYDLSFTGHSLGGGLATVAALATGRKAVVFNPAKMNDKLLNYVKISDKNVNLYRNNIDVIIVKNEMIDSRAPGYYIGNISRYEPAVYEVGRGNRVTTRLETFRDGHQDIFTRHGIDSVFATMDRYIPAGSK